MARRRLPFLPRVFCIALALALVGPALADEESGEGSEAEPELEGETIELIPEDRASWTASNLFAPITGLFLGGPGYWYKERTVRVETTPPGAVLDLFYVRQNFQKAYEQADSPVTIVLPSRIAAGPRDTLTIRALADGFRQQEVRVRVRSREDTVLIDLEPLPNTLAAVVHTYFAGRGSLEFLTAEALTFRMQKRDEGFSVVLTETALTPAATASLEGIHSHLIRKVKPQQLGEDLVVGVELDVPRDDVEVRQRQSFDPVRDVHTFALDLLPKDGEGRARTAALAALARIRTADVTGCAGEFDSALRTELDPAELSRALAPKGSFTDKYLRAAVKRLGEVSPGGVVTLMDGSTFDTGAQIELSAAASQASEAQGYLALLRRFVAELEPETYRRETLRGLVAPELGAVQFDALLDRAEERERICLAQAS